MDQAEAIIWDITKYLCGCAKRQADYICDLEENLKSLKDKWEDLQNMKMDLKIRIEEAENTGLMQRSHLVDSWLNKVDAIQQEIIEVREATEIEDKCLSKCCLMNCKLPSYSLAKKAVKMLRNVDNLAAEWKRFNQNFEIAHKRPTEPIEMPQDEVVGLDWIFNKVWKSIEEENVGIIGLYGMGGVGKTTLLKKINNELGKRRLGFNIVMWVVVSKDPNLDRIMDNIRKSVGIRDDIWSHSNNQDEKAAEIYRVLKQKKFVLLLDDVWDRLDLELVGVPHPGETNFQSKVLFTTRLEHVCVKMRAQRKFRVEVLTEEDALELFYMKVGEETLSSHPNIPELAMWMVKECQGLPLSLTVIGSAMAGVKSVEAWEHSINILTSSSWTAPDLETKVFSILKFSYDKLDEVQKRCFLYCALYPEGYEILVLDLIEKWMWEKFLHKDMTMSVEDMRVHGESVIEKLKLSCLLESVEDDLIMYHVVKMNDVIRGMALSLMAQDEDDMELVQSVSIINDWESQKILDPPNVTTLVLLKEHFRVHIQHQLEDIKYMKKLKVLELNVSGGAFVDIGSLLSLEYLSFHMTEETLVPEFWINLQSLTNLKFLSFQKIYGDIMKCDIPLGVLSSLQELRVFRIVGGMILVLEERRMLEELESLPNIEELGIEIWNEDGLSKLLDSTKLQSCICGLDVGYMDEKPILSLRSMSGMKQLQQIEFSRLNIKSGQYCLEFETCCLTKLRSVRLFSCSSSITHVTWLKYVPLLRLLHIYDCKSMKQVIKEEEEEENNANSSSVFSSLVDLTLHDLPNLESIYKAPLPFPSIKSIRILNCPKLKMLPF